MVRCSIGAGETGPTVDLARWLRGVFLGRSAAVAGAVRWRCCPVCNYASTWAVISRHRATCPRFQYAVGHPELWPPGTGRLPHA